MIMEECKAVVFDMAGTTVDEDNIVYKTLQQAIVKHGVSVTLQDVLNAGGGKEKFQATCDVLHEKNAYHEETARAIFADFQTQLKEAYQSPNIKPFNDVLDTFEALRQHGIKVILNTGYNRFTATTLVNKLGWQIGREIDMLITADDVARSRPYPDMIEFATRQTGIEPGAMVKVGDSTVDIEEGKNGGCGLSIGITTGAHSREQLLSAQPDYVIDSLGELKDILLKDVKTS